MIDFLLILFFSKTLLLTPNPIDINGSVEIHPSEPLKAITEGASLQLDVSSAIGIGSIKDEGILKLKERVLEKFPSGKVHAQLITADNKSVSLEYEGNYSYRDHSIWLTLAGQPGVPTDLKFNKVRIESEIPLQGVKVLWKNYMQ
jgi:hypothetical protein